MVLSTAVLAANSIFENEIEALKHFKNSITDDPTGALLDWNSSSIPHCNWTGIQCDDVSERVISISIQQTQLKGEISPYPGNLSSLQVLDLSYNSSPILSGILPTSSFSSRCSSSKEVQLHKVSGMIPVKELFPKSRTCRFRSIPPSVGNLKELLALDFSVNRLSGIIPQQIGNLTSLQVLQLYENSIAGIIPTGLGRCTNINLLNLYTNKLTGSIPDLGNMVYLQILRLYDNQLNSTIPPSLFKLKSLVVLQLSENNLLGNVSSEISLLESLRSLTLHGNKLTGSIPISITRLVNLTYLTMSINYLTGSIPSSIGSLHNLRNLSLSNNNLDGSIPSSITNCMSIRVIDLTGNSMVGDIPQGLGKLSNLTVLSIGDNRLSGKIPEDIFNCSSLKILNVAHNNLSGFLNPSIGRLYNLQILQIHGNLFSGSIPVEIGNLTSLFMLNMGKNRFSGTIPVDLANISFLQSLFLGNNDLEGRFPEKIFELKELTELYLMNNKFVGSNSDSFSKLEMLSVLDLSGNRFNGSIPDSMTKLTRLISLDLSHNLLTGSISGIVIVSMKNIQLSLSLSNNFLTGKIPNELGKLEMVQVIDFSNNNLSGNIPVTIQNCRNLQTLDLSQNKLTGMIPEGFATMLTLEHLNLSFNQIEGRAPDTGIFRNVTAVGLVGNPSLCFTNATDPCASSRKQNHSHHLSRKNVLIFAILGFLAVITGLSIAVLRYRHARKPKVKEYTPSISLKRFDRKELEDATEGVSEKNIVGTSSLSTVYKGKLQDGTMIAVKSLNFRQFSAESDKSFDREMKILAILRHRNLVKVLGYAWESGRLKALVLEYMENGNLDRVIHDSGVDRSRWNLAERVEVLVSVSRALVYLHSGYDFPIVHSDLKPSNILLDKKWDAHVSDFGTARFIGVHEKDGGSVTTASTFEGTIGYLAPEFAYMRKKTTKIDVFSFGIIVMELLTRKRPTGLTEVEGVQITLPQLVDRALTNGMKELIDIVDPNLASNFPTKQGLIKQLLKLALSCTRTDPDDHPDMNEVLSTLTKISKQV
uniref:non-specific serine/threonine protein kinase n=1 Tax=Tanacetum cinerariifolium TaxID=118510 RepID=A0A6L2KQC1_TANCI|nr:LRR receptor-like serine/threonine-protein kinase FLS2 [Tanacetum cinerariifolium]